MRLSLPLSLSPLLMLLLLLLQLNLLLLSLLLLLLSLLLTFHFFHTRTALASNSKSRCFAQAAAQPTAISSARNGEHALPGANSNTCLLGSPLPTRRTQKDRQSASSVCRPRPSPRPAFRLRPPQVLLELCDGLLELRDLPGCRRRQFLVLGTNLINPLNGFFQLGDFFS